jgi:hypothetical protein
MEDYINQYHSPDSYWFEREENSDVIDAFFTYKEHQVYPAVVVGLLAMENGAKNSHREVMLPLMIGAAYVLQHQELANYWLSLGNHSVIEAPKVNTIAPVQCAKEQQTNTNTESYWLTEIVKLTELANSQKFIQYVATNAVMSLVYFSMNNNIAKALTIIESPYIHYAVSTVITICANVFINYDMIINSGYPDNISQKCIGEAAEE